MISPAIHIKDLKKIYTVNQQEAGAAAAIQSLVHRRKAEVAAVDGISFSLSPGEIVLMLAAACAVTSGILLAAGIKRFTRERVVLA